MDTLQRDHQVKVISRIATLISLSISLLVFAAWIFDISILKNFSFGTKATKFNTSLCLVLANCTLLLISKNKWDTRRSLLFYLMITYLSVFAILPTTEYYFSTNLNVDEFFLKDDVHPIGSPFSGRPSPSSLACLILSICALIALKIKSNKNIIADGISITLFFISLFTAMGYLYGIQEFSSSVYLTNKMALPTSLAYFFLSMGLLTAQGAGSTLSHHSRQSQIRDIVVSQLASLFFTELFLGWLQIYGAQHLWYSPSFGVALFIIINFLIVGILVFFAAGRLVKQGDKIREAEKLLRESKLIAGYGSYTVDLLKGTWMGCEVFDKLFGIDKNHARTIDGWQTTIHNADVDFVQKQFEAAIESKQFVFDFEHRVFNVQTQSVLWVRNQGQIQIDENKTIHRIIGNVTDITKSKQASDQLSFANCLYAFISQLNQAIVQSHSEVELFDKACIAGISFGTFKVVSIAILDQENKRPNIVSQCGYSSEELKLFNSSQYNESSAQQHILTTGKHYLSNELLADHNLSKWHSISVKRGWQSYMALPLKKNGRVYATFSFLANEKNIFTEEIIQLLTNAAADISFAIDVFVKETEKEKALVALKQSEENYKEALTEARRMTDIMDNLPNYIYIKNLNREYIFANEITLKLFKLKREQLLGKRDVDIMPTEALQNIHDIEERIIRTGETVQTEMESEFFGVRYSYLETKYPLYDSDGKIWAMCGISTDISKIKSTERDLVSSRAQFKSVLQTAKQSIFILDQDGQIIFANQFAELTFGFDREEMSGMTLFSLLTSLDEANYWSNNFEQEVILEAEFTGARKDGSKFPVELSLSHWQTGTEKQYCAIIRDISDRRDREFRKSLSNQILSLLNEDKDLEEVLQNSLDLIRAGLNLSNVSLNLSDSPQLFKCIESDENSKKDSQASSLQMIDKHALVIQSRNGRPEIVCSCGQQFACVENSKSQESFSNTEFYSGKLHIKTFQAEGQIPGATCINNQFRSLLLIQMQADEKSVCYLELKHKKADVFDEESRRFLKNLSFSIKHTILRAQSKEAILQSEMRFRNVLSDLHVGVLIQDKNAEILMSNDRALELLGISEETLLGKSSFDPSWHVIHEDGSEFPGHTHPAPVSIATGKPVHNVTMGVFHPLKNDFVWLLVNSAPRYHPNRELTEVIVTFEDITELTITGSGIKVREEKYRLLFDNMPAGIMVCEVSFDSIGRPFDCHFIGGNLAFELKTGRKASEQMGKDAAHLPLKWPQGVLEKCYEVAVTGKPVNFELYDEHLQKYFKTRIFSPRYGQFAYVFYDITERKTAEKELGKSEHFNKEILRSLKSKLAVIDKHGQIITTNEAWNNYTDEEDETNFRKNELESNYFADCEIASNAGDNVARVTLEAMKKVLSGELSHFYLEYPRPTLTSERWYSLAIMKFRNDEPMIVCLYEDISARKTAEIEREKAINDIVARNKNLKQFSYIVSHNLRAPVANIMGISRFLQQDTKSLTEDDTTGLINGLITSVDKLDIVIQDLNAVLQIRNQSSEIKDQISLTQLVQDIKTSIAGTLKATKTKINVDFREVDKITTVKSYLYSIIYNLISNSIKYRREKVAPVISITTHRTAAQIELIIQDNGMGIDMKKYGDQLFGLYKRFHYHTDGKGVGLFMVKTQIESLGGKIRVESVVNEGTTFYISFEN